MNKFHHITNQELLNELCRRLREKELSEEEFTGTVMKNIAQENLKNHAKK